MSGGSAPVASGGRHPSPRVHVETIRKTYRGKVYQQHLLRSSYREGGKVKHRPSTGSGHRFGLVCTREGIPVAVEVFPGNTIDSTTVGSQVEKLRERRGARPL